MVIIKSKLTVNKNQMVSNSKANQSRKFKFNKNFQPMPREGGNEFYPKGIFEFNITKLLAFIQDNPDTFPVEACEIRIIRIFQPRI